MASILVLGGGRYVGSHTAKLLSREGHEVTVFDDLSKRHCDPVWFDCFAHTAWNWLSAKARA